MVTLPSPFSNSSDGSLSINNDYIFDSMTERDDYFAASPSELEEDLYCVADGVLYKYVDLAWTDVSTVIQGDKGDAGTNGSDGEDGESVTIQYSEYGDSDWHEAQADDDVYWRWSIDGGSTYSNDFVRFRTTSDTNIATVNDAGTVKPDGTTITISEDGTISADVAAAIKVVVADETEMLALSEINNLYIATRTDLEQIYYLNADADPSVLANWEAGASVSDTVASFTGASGTARTGAVEASTGDYTMNMVQAEDTSTGTTYYLEVTDGALYLVEV